jgi:hypothetical protein
MAEFPDFASELNFVEQMVTEESVFCLPSKVSNTRLSTFQCHSIALSVLIPPASTSGLPRLRVASPLASARAHTHTPAITWIVGRNIKRKTPWPLVRKRLSDGHLSAKFNANLFKNNKFNEYLSPKIVTVFQKFVILF